MCIVLANQYLITKKDVLLLFVYIFRENFYSSQLELTQENQEPIYIPIEDIAQITTIGANIRLSTTDMQ